jgi:excisionase family DNA binding protein
MHSLPWSVIPLAKMPRAEAHPLTSAPNRHSRRHPDKPPSSGRRYASLKNGAAYVGVTDRTIRQWIVDGVINGYRINSRLVRVDLNELDEAMVPFGGRGGEV